MGRNIKRKRIDIGDKLNREKNIDIICITQPEFNIDDVNRKICHRRSNLNVETKKINVDQTIQIFFDGKNKWQLNSLVDPEKAALEWSVQFNNEYINEHSVILIFGMGDGRAVGQLLRRNSISKVIIYEPSLDIFFESINRSIWADIFMNYDISIFVIGLNDELFFHKMQDMINYANVGLLRMGVLPNYDRIFLGEYKRFRETINDVIRLVAYTKNTEIERADEIAHNMYKLSADIIGQYSVVQLFSLRKRIDIEKIPAILVAAGPSLDENIECLRKFKNRAFILAVDTALNTLLDNDIVPDMTISVDSRKPMELFDNIKFKDVPIVLSQQSNSEIIKKNSTMHFYEIDEEGYLNKIFMELTGKVGVQLPTGGSVANNALSLLVLMGFNTIILVGQDLAYPDMQEHTKNAYKKGSNIINTDEESFLLVDDVNGNKVYTKENMNIYRRWMEYYIEGNKNIKVINTSDCGAYISGTDRQTLEECFNLYAMNKIDIEEMFNEIKPWFTQDELQSIHARLLEIPNIIKEIYQKVNMGILLCEEIEQIYTNATIMIVKDKLEKIMDIVSKIELYPEAILLRTYMIEVQYEVQENIYSYSEEDTVEKQIKDSVLNSKKMLEAYKSAIEKFEKDIFCLTEINRRG